MATHDLRSPGAILSRLLVVLALVLVGLPEGHAHRLAATSGHAAQGTIEQTLSMPSAQRHVVRAPLPDDTSPDAVLPGAADPAWADRTAAALSPEAGRSFLPTEIRIQPPVRGPPAA